MLRTPQARKEAIPNKMLSPHPPTIVALAKQEGISEATLLAKKDAVTPAQQHQRHDKGLLEYRHGVYQATREAHPEHWSGDARNWRWIDQVQHNPDRKMLMQIDEGRIPT
jgi:hypothetical protein